MLESLHIALTPLALRIVCHHGPPQDGSFLRSNSGLFLHDERPNPFDILPARTRKRENSFAFQRQNPFVTGKIFDETGFFVLPELFGNLCASLRNHRA